MEEWNVGTMGLVEQGIFRSHHSIIPIFRYGFGWLQNFRSVDSCVGRFPSFEHCFPLGLETEVGDLFQDQRNVDLL
jgi:hypothetical protein